MTSRVSDKDSRENIRKVFNLFDDEKTGFISIKNLRRITKELGEGIEEHELQEMIDKADIDHDGVVSEEEFYLILTKKSGWSISHPYHYIISLSCLRFKNTSPKDRFLRIHWLHILQGLGVGFCLVIFLWYHALSICILYYLCCLYTTQLSCLYQNLFRLFFISHTQKYQCVGVTQGCSLLIQLLCFQWVVFLHSYTFFSHHS